MSSDRPARRMTLRQLLTHSEKYARDMIEHTQTALLNQLADFRDLSRPVRRRSHYPTLVAVHNALKKLAETGEQCHAMAEQLEELLEEVRQHAKRERINRL